MADLSNKHYLKSVLRTLHKVYGEDVDLYFSSKKDKKFMVQDPNGKWVHFGSRFYDDWHSHKDPIRREKYLKRATNIKGNWKDNMFSPNNLALRVLWDWNGKNLK